MTTEDIERLRRSVVMVQRSSVRPLPKQRALELIEELARLDEITRCYGQVIGELRAILDDLEE